MTEFPHLLSRREALGAGFAAGALSTFISAGATAAHAQGGAPATGAELDSHRRDWAWFIGSWTVWHRRLNGRLVGSTDWEEFSGTCTTWATLDGLGNVDDNVLELPAGDYRAMTIRAFDPASRRWAIWWLDARNSTRIDPPVYGRFENGVGTFLGDDVHNGRPIKVRFRWLDTDTVRPRWEQAYSPDNGATWEVNWLMQFARAA
jgi:hypothetical protein